MQYRTLHMGSSPEERREQPRWDFTADPLDAVEARVLGSLIEKEQLTPDVYPLSLNGLMAACNQKSSRDPVMELTEGEIRQALDSLRAKGLAREILPSSESRVHRFRHVADLALNITGARLAAMCVLLLRGPQTPGEIRSRTGRLYGFDGLEEVQETLDRLADQPGGPLVVELARQPGSRESRYMHLLGGPVDDTAPKASTGPVATASGPSRIERLEDEVTVLQEELARLRQEFDAFRQELGS